ncbi:hypothetical protein RIF29_23110 [Crotalaria pallida]|uniref:Uncharacterized protein n=1 Tax=Crotalaria pallida TaxID=3830 RepID=A0AAN9F5R7_CROPI
MELKAVLSSRRGFGFLKASNPKKSSTSEHHHMLEAMVRKANNGSGGIRVVSCTEEGVVRMKIVVKKSELKQLVEVMNNGANKDEAQHRPIITSTVEQRLNNLLWKKHQSRAKQNKGNYHKKCWSPALQCIPEELSV